jgi:hypothetical protein
MKIIRSGRYICKIVYNMSSDKFCDSVEYLLKIQPFVVCKIHSRIRNRVWFHDVENCDNSFLKKYNLAQPINDENIIIDDYYDPFCGFIYVYDEEKDIYVCSNQILKNTGGVVWNLYIKLYTSVV